MERSRVETNRRQREKKRRKRNRLYVINLALFVFILAIAAGGYWSGVLDFSDLTSGDRTHNEELPAASGAGDSANPNEASLSNDSGSIASDANKQPDASTESAPDPVPDTDADDEDTILLSFVGDMMNAGNVADVVERNGYDYPYLYVQEMFNQDDLTIGNLETPITERGVPAEDKEFVYKSAPDMAQAMRQAGFDVMNLANNHVMDQGEEGLLDTFTHLRDAEVAYVGAGKDGTEAYSPYIVEKKGMKIAVFGFSRVIPEVSWYAGKNKPGTAATYDPARAVQAIEQVRGDVDLIIVIPHWGKEREDYPDDNQSSLAKSYIDAGADLVVGGHPHVLQGFEMYKGKWIAYSLGNFIFTRSTNEKTWDTMVLEAEVAKDGTIRLRMKPYYTELGQAVPMSEEEGQQLIEHVESISYQVNIDKDGYISQK